MYILGLLTIFLAIYAAVLALPLISQEEGYSGRYTLLKISLEEMVSGCGAYASEEAWNTFFEGENYQEEGARAFKTCLLEAIEAYKYTYEISVNIENINFVHEGSTVRISASDIPIYDPYIREYKSGTSDVYPEDILKFDYSYELGMDIVESSISENPETLPYKVILNVKIQVTPAEYQEMRVIVYYLEESEEAVIYHKIYDSLLPVVSGNIDVEIPLYPELLFEESLRFIVRIVDEGGISVWSELMVEVPQ